MQPTEMAYRIGRLEAGMTSAHTRAANHWELLMVMLREQRKNGHGLKLPWVQIAAYGATALLSVLGIAIPEKVAAVLRALMH